MAIVVPRLGTERCNALAGRRLRQSDAIARREADVGVMQQPIDGSGCQGLGHQLVEAAGCTFELTATERFS